MTSDICKYVDSQSLTKKPKKSICVCTQKYNDRRITKSLNILNVNPEFVIFFFKTLFRLRARANQHIRVIDDKSKFCPGPVI